MEMENAERPNSKTAELKNGMGTSHLTAVSHGARLRDQLERVEVGSGIDGDAEEVVDGAGAVEMGVADGADAEEFAGEAEICGKTARTAGNSRRKVQPPSGRLKPMMRPPCSCMTP